MLFLTVTLLSGEMDAKSAIKNTIVKKVKATSAMVMPKQEARVYFKKLFIILSVVPNKPGVLNPESPGVY